MVTEEINNDTENINSEHVWEQAPLYEWRFDLTLRDMIEVDSKAVDQMSDILKTTSEAAKNLSVDEIKKSMQQEQSPDALVCSVVNAGVAPTLAKKVILYGWSEYTNGLCVIAALIAHTNSTGYKLIKHTLQYGPLNNWDEEVAYDATLDKQIEKFLLLDRPSA